MIFTKTGIIALFVIVLAGCGLTDTSNQEANFLTSSKKAKWAVFNCGSGDMWTRDGALSGNHKDEELTQLALDNGMEHLRLDYARPSYSVTGQLMRRYVDFYFPSGYPVGLIIEIHGGGGYRGYADNLGNLTDPESTISVYKNLVDQGYVVAAPEYTRGWTDGGICDNCPWNQSDSAYLREHDALNLSVRDIFLAVARIDQHMNLLYDRSLDTYVSGGSFGGTLSAYLAGEYRDPGICSRLNIKGAFIMYGAVANMHIKDLTPAVPVFTCGGYDDPIVPYMSGNIYHNPNAIDVIGPGGIATIWSNQVPVMEVGSCGIPYKSVYLPAGHGVGWFAMKGQGNTISAFNHFIEWAENGYKIGKEIRSPVFNSKGRPAGYELIDSCIQTPLIPDC